MPDPYRSGLLSVGDGHQIYWEECGRADGVPAVFLHGGPGSGCKPRHRTFFDPYRARAVLFDQRGCGRSMPEGRLEANTTPHLVEDLERLRDHLGIDRWVVVGVSWGSTLGIAYAEAHPERILGLLVEGIYLATQGENAWWLRPDGVARFFPLEYEAFIDLVPPEQRGSPQAVLDHYFALMTGADEVLRAQAIRAWSRFEYQYSALEVTAEDVDAKLADPNLTTHSLFECHYFRNGCFLAEGQLLDDAGRLTQMPVHIVQSRYDMVCPPAAAFALYRRIPGSQLHIIPRSGHMVEGQGAALVIRLVDDLIDRAARTM